jgi:ABC-type dipeptide/oligopeptide/nickel transport system permease component
VLRRFAVRNLVRLAPGFDVPTSEQLDPHLNAESVQALQADPAAGTQRVAFLLSLHSMNRAVHGDLGTSLALGQPVRTLLRDRAPLTLRSLKYRTSAGSW